MIAAVVKLARWVPLRWWAYAGIGAAVLIWHSHSIRDAHQEGEASGYTKGYEEYKTKIYDPETQALKERIQELEGTLTRLATQRQQSAERVRIIEGEAAHEKEDIRALPDRDAALRRVRELLARPITDPAGTDH